LSPDSAPNGNGSTGNGTNISPSNSNTSKRVVAVRPANLRPATLSAQEIAAVELMARGGPGGAAPPGVSYWAGTLSLVSLSAQLGPFTF